MSIISFSSSTKTSRGGGEHMGAICGTNDPTPKKVLEEEDYLGRMAKIIRRDFFPGYEFQDHDVNDLSTCTNRMSERTEQTLQDTPGTDRTHLTTNTTTRQVSCSLSLDDYLDKYTSEDNAYFEKIQCKELRRHRHKYPYLYKDRSNHNKGIRDQLQLPSIEEQASLGHQNTSTKMIGWTHNPQNTLFNVPDVPASKKRQSTINYNSNRLSDEPIFKMPAPSKTTARPKSFSRFNDKVGIDGKLISGSETPEINGYSFILPPETPNTPIVNEVKSKMETNRFFISSESPRDELAHRLYLEKVAKNIRTPKSCKSETPSLRTPSSSRKSYANFSFSPERVKSSRSRVHQNK